MPVMSQAEKDGYSAHVASVAAADPHGLKTYVDTVAGTTVAATTTAALPAYTYSNGTAGVGATMTASANGAFPTLDTTVTLVANDPSLGTFLHHNGANSFENGLYMLTTQGSGGAPWVATRLPGRDTAASLFGARVRVRGGLQSMGGEYIFRAIDTPVIGTDPIFYWRTDLSSMGGNEGARWMDDFSGVVATTNGQYGQSVVQLTASGSSAAPAQASTNSATERGAVTFGTGTTAAGFAGVADSWTLTGTQPDGGGCFIASADVGFDIEFYAAVPTLSTGAQEFADNLGLSKQRSASQVLPADFIGFLYDRTSSVNWQICASSGGTSTGTKTDSGIAVAAGTMVRLRILKDPGQAKVRYYINNTLAATFTTNLPTATLVGLLAACFKSVGTTGTTGLKLDWVNYWLVIPRRRV